MDEKNKSFFDFLYDKNDNIGDICLIDPQEYNTAIHGNCIPAIYINGNVITGSTFAANNSKQFVNRDTHKQLYDLKYQKNEQFHKHDIIKASMQQWQHVSFDDIIMNTYNIPYAAAVYDKNIMIIFVGFYPINDKIITTLKASLSCKKIYLQSDDAQQLKRLAKQNKYKRLIRGM